MKFVATRLLVLALGLASARADLLYEVAAIPSPAGPNAIGATLAKETDGTVWLSWVEPMTADTRALRFSTYDSAAKKWNAAQEIHRGKDLVATSAEFPSLAVGANGHVTAVWSDGHGSAFFTQSADRGATWGAPTALTRESDAVEKFSVVALADGSAMAAWLDGRVAKTGAKVQQLFARVLDRPGADRLVDARVCDCCQTALTAFPDGSALLAYRGRSEEEFRDILVASYLDGQWDPSHANTHDRWKIVGCPVNGPRIASDGPRVAKAWFTGADDEPRVLVATSPDAGGIYTRAVRADLGHPVGRVDTLLLRDGTQLVTWIENTTDKNGGAVAALYLRRYGPGGNTQVPTQVAVLGDARTAGFPRIALVKDFDATPAQVVATFGRAGETPGVATLLITLPDEELLAEADSNCACALHGEELRGSAIRGQVLAVSPERGTLRVHHGPVPGVLRAGDREFKIAPNLLPQMQPGRGVLARIEQRNGEWWIFDVKLLADPKS